MPYIKSFPTASNKLRSQTDWRDRREQSTPVLNKILEDLKRKAEWTQQCSFLMKCRDSKVTPKGLRVNVPKGIMNEQQRKKWKLKCEMELVQRTIKRLYIKQQNADERIASRKLELRNRLKMGDTWIENTMRWLEKKAKEKAISKKESLKGKFNKLNAEKKLMEELFQTNEVTNLNEVNSGNLSKKVIYNNSSKILSSK